MRDLERLFAAESGITMREALGCIETHYATPESTWTQIVKLTRDRVVGVVPVERERCAIRLLPL